MTRAFWFVLGVFAGAEWENLLKRLRHQDNRLDDVEERLASIERSSRAA